MKRYSLITYMLMLGAWLMVSCSEETVPGGGDAGSRAMTIRLASEGATEPGQEEYSENVVRNASVFFFRDEAQPCTFMQRNISATNNVLNVNIDETVKGQSCTVFVVANHPGVSLDDAELRKMTLEQIKQVVISTTWQTGERSEEKFVMQGQTEVPITIDVANKDNKITLRRVASKIVLEPTVAESVTVNNITYYPDKAKMEVTLVNAAKKATVEGSALPSGKEQEYMNIHRTYTSGENGVTHIPLYSYPNTWSAGDTNESYLLFRIPWYYTQGGTQLAATYYYRVPIGSGKLESNKLYRISMNVEVLGSIDPTDVVKVPVEYEIEDWIGQDINASVDRYKYLELETNYVEMKNENRVDVAFSSSTNVTATLVNISFPDYSVTDYYDINIKNDGEPELPSGERPERPNITRPSRPSRFDRKYWNGFFFNEELYNQDMAKYNEEVDEYNRVMDEYETALKEYNEAMEAYEEWNKYFGDGDYSINIYGQTLTFEHTLASDVYVPYTYTIEVTNEDGLTEILTIKQYPPIYIEGESNERNGGSNRFIYGDNEGDWYGYVYDDRNNNIGSVANYDEGSNHNPNQYTIYATILDEGSDYVIGDPRQKESTSLSDLNDVKGGLQSYHPTRGRGDGQSEVDIVIAPAFKIASSWGQTTSTSYDQLEKRCASYQENGYPAGRWRVPTEAEIEFVVGLSDGGYIPVLFNGDYFASSGRSYNSDGGRDPWNSRGGNHAVRCVYDVWYWGDDKIADPNVFTWGDEPRN